MIIKFLKYKIDLILILLCVSQWLAIFQTGKVIYKADFINLSTICISILLIVKYKFYPLSQSNQNNYFRKWILFTLILYFIELVHSTLLYNQYGQNFLMSLSCSFSNIVVIAFFPLVYLQGKIEDCNFLKSSFKKIGFLCALLSIIQVFMYNQGIVFFDITGAGFRYETLRFGIAGHISSISLVISVFDFFENHKTKDLIYSIIESIFFVYALKTRTEILYLVFTIYFVNVIFVKRKIIRIIMFLFGIIFFLILFYKDFFYFYLNLLKKDSGILIRFSTMEYYIEQVKKYPLLGMGFIHASSSDILNNLLYGSKGYFYRDDVGIIGLLNEKGIIGVVWYLSLIFTCFFYAFKLYNYNKKKYIWSIAVCIYISMCSINIIYVNNLRIATLVVWISILYHYYLLISHESSVTQSKP